MLFVHVGPGFEKLRASKWITSHGALAFKTTLSNGNRFPHLKETLMPYLIPSAFHRYSSTQHICSIRTMQHLQNRRSCVRTFVHSTENSERIKYPKNIWFDSMLNSIMFVCIDVPAIRTIQLFHPICVIFHHLLVTSFLSTGVPQYDKTFAQWTLRITEIFVKELDAISQTEERRVGGNTTRDKAALKWPALNCY